MKILDRCYIPWFNDDKEVNYERNQYPHCGGDPGQRTYQNAFAERINVSQQHISRLAKDGTPSDRTIVDICREFGVNERWLRTGEGEMLMHLSREEEIMRFAATVIRDPSSEFQRRFVSVLARLTPEQ